MFNALIRTHHITSRKKVAKLKQAADSHNVFALLRSGGAPGIMYVEGEEKGVRGWVETVHVCLKTAKSEISSERALIEQCTQNLRYKDYQLVARPASLQAETPRLMIGQYIRSLHETDTVKDFGAQMHARGVFSWWRRAMGYAPESK